MIESKKEILEKNLKTRQQNVFDYQINIDNYILALEEINKNHDNEPGMEEFKIKLITLLETSKIEQSKEKIMVTVIEKQLKAL